jgi:hypothetical protein
MKFLFLAAFFSVGAFASEVSFKCDFKEGTFLNQFTLEAKKVVVNEGKFSNVEFDFTVKRLGRDTQPERLVVTRSGIHEFFAAGTLYNHPVTRLMSAIKGAEVEYINIMIDATPLNTSQIRMVDGMTYYGSCKSL